MTTYQHPHHGYIIREHDGTGWMDAWGNDVDVTDDMRAWLLDCFGDEADRERINLANHAVLIDGIERHYEGGMVAFMVDGDYPTGR